MKPFQLRVTNEKADLDTKIASLRDFIAHTQFASLNGNEQKLLSAQLEVMIQYSNILGERILGWHLT